MRSTAVRSPSRSLTLLVEVNWARGRTGARIHHAARSAGVRAGRAARRARQSPRPATGARLARGRRSRASGSAPASPVAQLNLHPVLPPLQRRVAAHRQPRPQPRVKAAHAPCASAKRCRASPARSRAIRTLARAWMLAIYQANPAAFDGNMNVLRAGAVLRIPDGSAARGSRPRRGDCGDSPPVRLMAWRRYGRCRRDRSRAACVWCRLPPPAARATVPRDAAAMQGRVRELEAQLAGIAAPARSCEMRSSRSCRRVSRTSRPRPLRRLSPLRSRPRQRRPRRRSKPHRRRPPKPCRPPSSRRSHRQHPPPPAEEAQPAPPAEATPAADKGAGSRRLDLRHADGILVGAGRAGRGHPGAVRLQRPAVAQAHRVRRLARAASRRAAADSISGRDFSSRHLASARAAAARRRVPGRGVRHARAPALQCRHCTPATAPRNVASSDETISGETAINLDQGDPLAEADFHMAYGLYDQAADLVRIAISREPGRRDLKLKLLEVFFVWGNKEQFLQTARELAGTRERGGAGRVGKDRHHGQAARARRRAVRGRRGVAAAPLGGIDLDLEGGQRPRGFRPARRCRCPLSGGDGIDLDIGSAFGELDASRASRRRCTDCEPRAARRRLHVGDASTGITRQMTQNLRGDNSPTVQAYGADLEAPTVEQPQLYGRRQPDHSPEGRAAHAAGRHASRPPSSRSTTSVSIWVALDRSTSGIASTRLRRIAHAGGGPRRALTPHHG